MVGTYDCKLGNVVANYLSYWAGQCAIKGRDHYCGHVH